MRRYGHALNVQSAARMAEIAQHYEVMKGTCGRLRYDSEGRVAGRVGGYKNTFPEMKGLPYTPATIAAAIRRGKGKVFNRIHAAVLEFQRAQLQDHLSAIANKAWDTRRRLVAWGASTDGHTAALKAWETRRRMKEANHQ
jgi:hypothetical protein